MSEKKRRRTIQGIFNTAANPVKRVTRWATNPQGKDLWSRSIRRLQSAVRYANRRIEDADTEQELSRFHTLRRRWRRQIKQARRKAKRTEFQALMDKPWTADARNNKEFRRWLLDQGLLSPNFAIAEASGRGRNPAGTDLPSNLIDGAQDHAFNLEIVRHRLGDRPLAILSWFRNPTHNARVGGAKDSRHMQGDATDFTVQTVQRFGAAAFDRVMNAVFKNGGFGTYPVGSRHADSRGSRARW